MKFKSVVLCILGFLVNCSVQAEDKKTYVEAGIGQIAYEEAGFRFVPYIGKLTLGAKVAEGLAIEGMAATGLRSSSVGVINLKVNNALGFYLRPYVNLSESVELFARAGFFRGNLTVSAGSFAASSTGTDFSYGVGIAIKPSQDVALTLDYTSFYNKNGAVINGATAGVRYSF